MWLHLCILSWTSCLLVLAYQAIIWIIYGTWDSLYLTDILTRFWSLDLLEPISVLPLEWSLKLSYILMNAELALSFWWVGVFFCLTAFLSRLIRK